MDPPVHVDLIYRGMDATSLAERETIARQLAVEFRVAVEETRRLLQRVDTPLRTHLAPEAAEQLAERLRAIGLQVDLVAAEPAQGTPDTPTPSIALTIPCRRCRQEIPVEAAACPRCGTTVASAPPPSQVREWEPAEPPEQGEIVPVGWPWPSYRVQLVSLLVIALTVIIAWQIAPRSPPPTPEDISSLPIPRLPRGQRFIKETLSLVATLRDLEKTAGEKENFPEYERRVGHGQEAVQRFLKQWPGAPDPLDPTTADQLRRLVTRTMSIYSDAYDLWRLYRQRPHLAHTDPDVELFLERYPGLHSLLFRPTTAPAGIDYLQMPEALGFIWNEGSASLNQLERLVRSVLPEGNVRPG